jgi:hypothetical protein
VLKALKRKSRKMNARKKRQKIQERSLRNLLVIALPAVAPRVGGGEKKYVLGYEVQRPEGSV